MSSHAVIKIYNSLISGDHVEMMVEVFEVQEIFILSILFRNMTHLQT